MDIMSGGYFVPASKMAPGGLQQAQMIPVMQVPGYAMPHPAMTHHPGMIPQQGQTITIMRPTQQIPHQPHTAQPLPPAQQPHMTRPQQIVTSPQMPLQPIHSLPQAMQPEQPLHTGQPLIAGQPMHIEEPAVSQPVQTNLPDFKNFDNSYSSYQGASLVVSPPAVTSSTVMAPLFTTTSAWSATTQGSQPFAYNPPQYIPSNHYFQPLSQSQVAILPHTPSKSAPVGRPTITDQLTEEYGSRLESSSTKSEVTDAGSTTQSPSVPNVKEGADHVKDDLYRKFGEVIRDDGPLEATNEKILNIFIKLTALERKIIMVQGSIKAFLAKCDYITVDGNTLHVSGELPPPRPESLPPASENPERSSSTETSDSMPVVDNTSGESGDEQDMHNSLIRRFGELLREGPLEVTSQKILNLFLRMSSGERRYVMSHRGIAEFLTTSQCIKVTGKTLTLEGELPTTGSRSMPQLNIDLAPGLFEEGQSSEEASPVVTATSFLPTTTMPVPVVSDGAVLVAVSSAQTTVSSAQPAVSASTLDVSSPIFTPRATQLNVSLPEFIPRSTQQDTVFYGNGMVNGLDVSPVNSANGSPLTVTEVLDSTPTVCEVSIGGAVHVGNGIVPVVPQVDNSSVPLATEEINEGMPLMTVTTNRASPLTVLVRVGEESQPSHSEQTEITNSVSACTEETSNHVEPYTEACDGGGVVIQSGGGDADTIVIHCKPTEDIAIQHSTLTHHVGLQTEIWSPSVLPPSGNIIPKRKYDLLVERVREAEERVVDLQTELCIQTLTQLRRDILENYIKIVRAPNNSDCEKQGLQKDYTSVMRNIQEEIDRVQILHDSNLSAVRDGLELKALPDISFTHPNIPRSLASNNTQPQQKNRSRLPSVDSSARAPVNERRVSECSSIISVESNPDRKPPGLDNLQELKVRGRGDEWSERCNSQSTLDSEHTSDPSIKDSGSNHSNPDNPLARFFPGLDTTPGNMSLPGVVPAAIIPTEAINNHMQNMMMLQMGGALPGMQQIPNMHAIPTMPSQGVNAVYTVPSGYTIQTDMGGPTVNLEQVPVTQPETRTVSRKSRSRKPIDMVNGEYEEQPIYEEQIHYGELPAYGEHTTYVEHSPTFVEQSPTYIEHSPEAITCNGGTWVGPDHGGDTWEEDESYHTPELVELPTSDPHIQSDPPYRPSDQPLRADAEPYHPQPVPVNRQYSPNIESMNSVSPTVCQSPAPRKPLPITHSSIPTVAVNVTKHTKGYNLSTETRSTPSPVTPDDVEFPPLSATNQANTKKKLPVVKKINPATMVAGAVAGISEISICDDITGWDTADDSNEWKQVSKKSKKNSEPATSETSSNFEKLIAKIQASYPMLSRQDVVQVVNRVRVQHGGLKGVSIAQILHDAADVIMDDPDFSSKIEAEVEQPVGDMVENKLYKTSICTFWQNGNCTRTAKECVYAHGKKDLRPGPKNIMCHNFISKGSCPYGEKCVFAHSKEEMKKAKAGAK